MSNWRDIKRKGLGDIHRTFQLPAVYISHAAGTPLRVDVRLHIKPVVSDQQGEDWGNAGKLLDEANRIIFQRSQISEVLPRAFVVFGNSEAYYTGPTKPEREGYVWCEVSEVPQAELTALLSDTDTDHPAWEGILS